MVAFVPVALGTPAVFMLIPPPMPFPPATFSRGVQLAALVICLAAVSAMFLDRLVEFVLGMNDPALTAVDVFGLKAWHCSETDDGRQDCP
jgi:hypothetical protein